MITEVKSSYRLLKQKVEESKEALAVGGKTPTGSGSTSSTQGASTDSTHVAARIEAKENAKAVETYSYGYIHKVYPQTHKVFVTVREEHPDEYGNPIFFNWHTLDQETAEALIVMPLYNFDPTTGQSLDNLVDHLVKVWGNSEGIYSRAELVYAKEDDTLLEGVINPVDHYYAVRHPEGLTVALRKMGYDEETIQNWMTLGRIQASTEQDEAIWAKGVIRIEGEAYWDQAVEEDTEHTERFKNAVEAWKDRNLSKMKTKLCHNPVLAFGGR